MFLGMTLCLPLAWLADCRRGRREENESAGGGKRLTAGGKPGAAQRLQPLVQRAAAPAKVGLGGEMWEAGVLLVPTALDLAATLLQNVGLLT